MIDQDLRRLKARNTELESNILPDLEHRTEFLFSQIITFPEGSPERERMEQEYTRLSRELRRRSDELFANKTQIANLEAEQSQQSRRSR